VLRTLIDTFESPEAFDMAISSRIVDLEDRLAQLNPDGDDFDAEEAGIAESQEKLSIEFIHGRVSRESKEKLQRDLDDHREALQARREAAGGDWEEKVRETKRLLQGAKDWAEVAERRLARGLRMVAFDFGAEFAETDELTKLRKSDASPFKMPDSDKVPEALSQWLNRLHAKLFAFQDRIEVRGLLSFDVGMDPDGDKTSRQASLQGRGSG